MRANGGEDCEGRGLGMKESCYPAKVEPSSEIEGNERKVVSDLSNEVNGSKQEVNDDNYNYGWEYKEPEPGK